MFRTLSIGRRWLFHMGAVFCAALFAVFQFAELSAVAAGPDEPDYPQAYQDALAQAIQRFDAHDFPGTLEALGKADQIVAGTPEALNIRGAIAIEERKFEDGERYCRQALEKNPAFFPARFNLGEIPFMKKDYAAARAVYRDLLRESPGNELIQYRIFMTHLLEKDDKAAEHAMKRIRFPGETGAYYYAQAAWSFAHGDSKEAAKWMKTADSLVAAEKNSNFLDVFYDLGWLQRPARR